MIFPQSGRNQAIREAIRKHDQPLSCAIERDTLLSLIEGDRQKVRQSVRQLVHLDQIIVYLALK